VAALTVDNAEITHIVNLFGCKNSTIIIKGKINAVTIGAYLELN
jgi:adenylyl cyclase-associated protein